jgi:Flp pilus assembly protein TadG
MIRTFLSTLSAFHQDRRGSIVLIFAFALVPIILAIGALIDYSLASRTKTALDAYADAAALTAVNQPAMALPLSTVKTNAETIFRAEAGNLKVATLDSVTATVTDSAFKRTAKVDYVATVPTTFMGLASINSVTVAGTATAESALPTYIDFYLLLDNTPSMGLGATMTDINAMVAATKNKSSDANCAFACHIKNGTQDDPNDYYHIAKKLGISMRIDVVRTATQKLMDTASQTQGSNSQFRMALYTFGAKAEVKQLTAVQTLTSNLTTAKTSAAAIDLMTVPYQNYKGDTTTDLPSTLAAVNNEIGTPGDGATADSPQKVLFFVSDGVSDREIGATCLKKKTTSQDPQTKVNYNRCQEPLNTENCASIKSRGIKIAVLYTTYLSLDAGAYYNDWYVSWIKPFKSEIATQMEACASPGLYFEVSPSQGIAEAMEALFKKALRQARLTR